MKFRLNRKSVVAISFKAEEGKSTSIADYLESIFYSNEPEHNWQPKLPESKLADRVLEEEVKQGI